MCLPAAAVAALPTVAAGASAAGGLFSAYGQYQAGKYQSDVARDNARVAELQARDANIRGGMEEDRYRRQLAQFQGQQRATAGAAGRDLASGTTADLLAQTADIGEQDALQIRSNAMREAYGFKVQAVNERQQGRLARAQGRNAAIGTILTSGAQAGGIYMNR